MLKRLGPSVRRAGDVSSDKLFPSKLEFNPPAHGTWNIVHIGMLVPEAHQIYVCPVNCMRGVVLTAHEMGAQDRFSCVILKEEDVTRGTVEQVTLDGIRDVLHKLEARGKLPPCVMVFPVCTHLFLGIHMAHIYTELEHDFPQVDFVRAFMDPISKRRLIPDKRLRKVMYDPLPYCEADPRLVALLGSDLPLDPDADLRQLLAQRNLTLASVHDCATYEEFKGLARASAMICVYPGGAFGAQKTADRLGREYLYLPSTFSYHEIEAQEQQLCHAFGLPQPNFVAQRMLCDEALQKAHANVGDTPIALDALAHPRPLGLARLLLEHDFAVREIYLDAVNPEESTELDWLRTHASEVEISSTVLPELRVAPRTRDREMLAIGQRAAWFCGTTHFVNIVQGAGLWGFAGVLALAALLADAWHTPKDPRDLIPRKGLGCASCI